MVHQLNSPETKKQTTGVTIYYKLNFFLNNVQVTNNGYQSFDGGSKPLGMVLGTASASVDGEVTGFGTYTLKVEAYATNTVGNSSMTSQHFLFSPTYHLDPTVTITRGGQNITNATTNASLGEGISLRTTTSWFPSAGMVTHRGV